MDASATSSTKATPGGVLNRHRYIESTFLQKSITAVRDSMRRRRSGRTRELEVREVKAANEALLARGGYRVAVQVDGENPAEELLVAVPELAAAELVAGPPSPPAKVADVQGMAAQTLFCTVECDTLTAALALLATEPSIAQQQQEHRPSPHGTVSVLSFANAEVPGGRYVSHGRAQEEDLCRALPQLYPSLCRAAAAGAYPIVPGTALLTRDCMAARHPATYALVPPPLPTVSVITAAMPCGVADRRPPGGWLGSEWAATVRQRIDAVLHAAVVSGNRRVVLGAFGCGAFGNPVRPVAAVFRAALEADAVRGAFDTVVFAIIDPVGTGNLKPFAAEIASLR